MKFAFKYSGFRAIFHKMAIRNVCVFVSVRVNLWGYVSVRVYPCVYIAAPL